MDANGGPGPRERGPVWPAAVWLVVIALLTLVPGGSGGGTATEICVFCGHRGLADFLLNVGLFVPLGGALALWGAGFRSTAVAGLLLTLGIETAQMSLLAGRDANLGDILANGSGAMVGWWVAARGGSLVRRSRGRDPGPALVAAAAMVAVLLGGLQLFRPALPEATYYTQWAADFGDMGRFRGEVRASRIGPLSLDGPPWRIEESDSVRQLLERGATIEVDVVAGRHPRGPAPIFSIYDEHQREVIMLAQYDDDLAFRYRLLADRVRLDRADLRAWGALDHVESGDTVTLLVRRDGRRLCIGQEGRPACGLGFSPGDTWMLLVAPDWLDPPLRAAVSMVWMLAAFLPVGAFIRRRRTVAIVAALVAAGLLLGPWATGFPPTPLREVVAALLGIAVGGSIASRRR